MGLCIFELTQTQTGKLLIVQYQNMLIWKCIYIFYAKLEKMVKPDGRCSFVLQNLQNDIVSPDKHVRADRIGWFCLLSDTGKKCGSFHKNL
jgi:hypothetical protein